MACVSEENMHVTTILQDAATHTLDHRYSEREQSFMLGQAFRYPPTPSPFNRAVSAASACRRRAAKQGTHTIIILQAARYETQPGSSPASLQRSRYLLLIIALRVRQQAAVAYCVEGRRPDYLEIASLVPPRAGLISVIKDADCRFLKWKLATGFRCCRGDSKQPSHSGLK